MNNRLNISIAYNQCLPVKTVRFLPETARPSVRQRAVRDQRCGKPEARVYRGAMSILHPFILSYCPPFFSSPPSARRSHHLPIPQLRQTSSSLILYLHHVQSWCILSNGHDDENHEGTGHDAVIARRLLNPPPSTTGDKSESSASKHALTPPTSKPPLYPTHNEPSAAPLSSPPPCSE